MIQNKKKIHFFDSCRCCCCCFLPLNHDDDHDGYSFIHLLTEHIDWIQRIKNEIEPYLHTQKEKNKKKNSTPKIKQNKKKKPICIAQSSSSYGWS